MNRTSRLLALTGILVVTAARAADGPVIRLVPTEGKTAPYFEIAGLNKTALEAARKRPTEAGQWEQFLKIQVVDASGKVPTDRPSLLGSWRVDGEKLRFEPRFPLSKGLTFRVTLLPSGLVGLVAADDKPVSADFTIPKPELKPTTVVSQIYPTAEKLPENQLKFYVHFSGPMARGGVYEHIQLLNEDGKPVFQPFIEYDEEMWDRTGKRITLLIDPGRIKHGLKPREEFGPVLASGKKYVLVIKKSITDAAGQPLKAEYRKTFTAGPADENPPDPKKWKLIPPADGSKPITLRFPESMNQALLDRFIIVRSHAGEEIDGTVAISEHETVWQFTPAKPLAPGKYRVDVDTIVEDLAGNSVGRPFEVDEFRKIEKLVETRKVEFPFEIKAPKSKP